jgi:glucose-1-phosphate cytidylyltransferase
VTRSPRASAEPASIVEYSRLVDDLRCPVVILCGGKGTRLREETEYKPKPMVEVGGKPILWHVMRAFAASGFREFVICLGYRGELIREYFLHYRAMSRDFTLSLGVEPEIVHHGGPEDLEGCRVTLVETGQETATGGRVTRAAPYLTRDRFIVSYGDAVTDLDARALLDFHRTHGRLGTVTAVRPTSRFGVLDLDGDSVSGFREKPRLDDWISAGYFVLERPVLERIGGDECALELEPLAGLARYDALRAFRHDGFWQPMDTYREYELLNQLWQSGDPPWLRPTVAAGARAR